MIHYCALLQVPFCEDKSVQLFRVAFFRNDFLQNPYFNLWIISMRIKETKQKNIFKFLDSKDVIFPNPPIFNFENLVNWHKGHGSYWVRVVHGLGYLAWIELNFHDFYDVWSKFMCAQIYGFLSGTIEMKLIAIQKRPKSLYRSHTGRHFYGTENEIWAGFGPADNTGKMGGL